MTTPTAADFAAARFAEHPDGRIAARTAGSDLPWTASDRYRYSDSEMAMQGWRIVTPAPDPSDPDVIEQAARRAFEARYAADYSDGNATWDLITLESREAWRAVARAVLTLPPARDPKVDELKAILVDFWTEASDDDWTEEECAVYLASRGVRVGGGEG